jgi:hypothetical protein
MLGRCLRLMQSVHHPRLKDSVGEMLWAACDCDAAILCDQVGYGNVAGFLFNKGIMSAPTPAAAGSSATNGGGGDEEEDEDGSSKQKMQINPITGTEMAPKEKSVMEDMTEEEREREMDKLFVLFDRLERSGALPASQNPVRKAIEKSQMTGPVAPAKDEDDD